MTEQDAVKEIQRMTSLVQVQTKQAAVLLIAGHLLAAAQVLRDVADAAERVHWLIEEHKK